VNCDLRIIFDLSNQNNMTQTKYTAGQTIETKAGFIVTILYVVSRSILRVSYGIDSNGNDIIGLININTHI
jgi:hypothetical protein